MNTCKATKKIETQKKMTIKKGVKVANNSKARRAENRKGKFGEYGVESTDT
jgi:hypothetical protein